MTPLQRFQAALQRDQDRLNARLNEDAELVRCFKAEDEGKGIVWAIGSAIVATREPSRVSPSRPAGRVSTIARGSA